LESQFHHAAIGLCEAVKRSWKIIFSVVLLTAIGWFFVSTRSTTPEAARQRRLAAAVETNVVVAVVSTNPPVGSPAVPPGQAQPLLGETILRDYASANTTPEQDLTQLAHLMNNFSLLVKSSADRPMSANEDWAAAFRGLNPAHERFLPDGHVALDAQGRLVDRWGTPLFFHALGNHRFDLRSAGPDKKLWTADDIHRNADGSFRRGAALNPASLLEPTPAVK
jgi:hypothetical protein